MVKPVFCYLKASIFILIVFLTCWSPAAAQTGATQVRVNPAALQVKAGETGEVTIQVVNVTGLYAFDVALSFDSQVVEVVDSDATQDGIQVGLGTFLDSGFVILNSADNGTGTVRFAMTQLNPAQPVSGTGVLVVVRLLGKQVNQGSALQLTKFQLATNVGTEIIASPVNGQVQVVQTLTAPTNTAVPTQKASPAVPTRTPLPPTAVPTRGPSPTSAPIRVQPTSTQLPTQTPIPTPTTTILSVQVQQASLQTPVQDSPQNPLESNPVLETQAQVESDRSSLEAAGDVSENEELPPPGEDDPERAIVLFEENSGPEEANGGNPGLFNWIALLGSGLIGLLLISALMVLIIVVGTVFFLRRK